MSTALASDWFVRVVVEPVFRGGITGSVARAGTGRGRVSGVATDCGSLVEGLDELPYHSDDVGVCINRDDRVTRVYRFQVSYTAVHGQLLE